MRKLNSILSVFILVMFVIHAVLGAFNLIGIGSVTTKTLSRTMVILIIFHTIIGIILTLKSLKVWKKTGAAYFRDNLVFWARRISGFAVMVLIFFHFTAFENIGGNNLRLAEFNSFRLIMQIILVCSIAVHVITNVKPILISFGIKKLKPKAGDIIFWLSAVLLFAAVGFILYYVRWNTV